MQFYSPEAFNPDVSIGYLARRVFQLSHAALEPMFADAGLTGTQWSALVSIWFGRTTCAEIARELNYDKGATTRLMDVLEERGWVTRDRDRQDRRFVNLALTPTGQALALGCRDRVLACWNGWLGDWDADDVTQLIRLLNKLHDRLQQDDAACA